MALPQSTATKIAILETCQPDDPAGLLKALEAVGFSGDVYRNSFEDLKLAYPDTDAATAHFFRLGMLERRRFPIDIDVSEFARLAKLKFGRPQFRAHLLSALTNASAGSIHAPLDNQAIVAFQKLMQLRQVGCKPFALFGDSHSNLYFRSPVSRDGMSWLCPIHFLCSAGSAQGLANPASRSGYGQLIANTISVLRPTLRENSIPLFFQFGQVDAEFVYMFQRLRAMSIRFEWDGFMRFAETSVKSYFDFLESLAFPPDMVSVISLFPPALSDKSWAQGYVNAHVVSLETNEKMGDISKALRVLEVPNLKTRTRMHAEYNALLKACCNSLGYRYIDNFKPFLRGKTINMAFIPQTLGCDHHLEFGPTKDAIEKLLMTAAL